MTLHSAGLPTPAAPSWPRCWNGLGRTGDSNT